MKDGGDNTNPKLLTAWPARTHNTDALAIKLNNLRVKSAQYNSHKDFPYRCIQEKLVPKGLELNLEPTIGIYDKEFIDNSYFILKDFSLIVIKQIVTYCKKTKEKTQTSITEIEATLKQQLKKDDYAEILNITEVNETVKKQILHQRKFKKFNTLNYKPKPTVKTTNFTEGNKLLEKSRTIEKRTYAIHEARQFEHANKKTSHRATI